jgi:hypothetical protein
MRWRTTCLYLRRNGQQLQLSIEHRAAPGADRLALTLKADPPALALEIEHHQPDAAPPVPPSCIERIQQVLAAAQVPLTQKQIRDTARMRTRDVGQALAALIACGTVIKSAGGYHLDLPF